MENTRDRPIRIVGGGIAGLSLGIALRNRGIETELFETTRYPRHRVCGEFISGVSAETLTELGVHDLLADAERCQTTKWFEKSDEIYSVDLPESAYGISRHRIDQRMADRFENLGGDLKEGQRYRFEENETDGFVVASGRPRRKGSSWIGLKAHISGLELHADLEMHLGEHGYLGASRIEDGKVNVCGLFKIREGLAISKETALLSYLAACSLDHLRERILGGTFDPESFIAVNAFEFGKQERSIVNAVRLGDAHSIIGPFTGHGMSMAFQSAAIALPILDRYADGLSSWGESIVDCENALAAAFRTRIAASQTIHPLLTQPLSQKLIKGLARRNWLPFSPVFQLLR